MTNTYLDASELNAMIKGCNAITVNSELAIEIVNNVDTRMVFFTEGEFYNRNFFMLNNQLYVAVSPKDLGSYQFYKLVKYAL